MEINLKSNHELIRGNKCAIWVKTSLINFKDNFLNVSNFKKKMLKNPSPVIGFQLHFCQRHEFTSLLRRL